MARLTKIYTRTGDTGRTGLVGGHRVSKDSPRIWAGGSVDELNSAIGLARACNREEPSPNQDRIEKLLARVQNELFHLGAEIATMPPDFRRGMPCIGRRSIVAMEKLLDTLRKELGPLPEFILPAGSRTAATLHLARAICRRAERQCVHLAGEEEIGANVIPYLNRLGDVLFMLARLANHGRGVAETYWQK